MTSRKDQEVPAHLSQREKYWDEIVDTERIERLRLNVVHLLSRLEQAERCIMQLLIHQHGESGLPLVGIVESSGRADVSLRHQNLYLHHGHD